MKIVVIGASGTIGSAVVKELEARHEIVTVGHRSGDITVDITSAASIQRMFQAIGRVDAVVSATGSAHFGPFETLTEKEFLIGISNKLMGQINLVLLGRDFVNDGGSFTLTSGVLSHDPIYCGAAVTTVNAGLEGFVLGASIEMPRGIRINAVSPGVVEESMERIGSFFRGHIPVPVSTVALAYSKSVEGRLNGQVFHAQ
ncbi:MAG: short chain dehydrogenase [Nitrospirales bacterium]|nr:MAG: short chain dehydrogenase [Nitrospirales bacterium]